MVTRNEAMRRAQAWMSARADIPPLSYPFVQPCEQKNGGRRVEVCCTIRFKGSRKLQRFGLARLYVANDGTLTVAKDRTRHVLDTLLATSEYEFVGVRSNGHLEVPRFDPVGSFSEAMEFMADAPPWLLEVDLADPRAGTGQYHAKASITTLRGTLARVPVVVFPSAKERGIYYRRHPPFHAKRVAAIVVTGEDAPANIRYKLYQCLIHGRNHNYYR